MNYINTVFFCCVMICANRVVLAEGDQLNSGEELLEDQDVTRENDTSIEVGPPDSHEAMNNREINPKVREKRSYEFLMGLINNNSKYEMTRVDPSLNVEHNKQKITKENIAASELLLELMVRIASHPDQWDKVHKLLQKIDTDLNIVKTLQRTNEENSSTQINITKKENADQKNVMIPEMNKFNISKSAKLQERLYVAHNNEWPRFDDEDDSVEPEKFIKKINKTASTPKYAWQSNNSNNNNNNNRPVSKSTYPKMFSYHRVTGKPFYLNKNPKAYIAVSVIAPKPINTRSHSEDLTLENELQQLKPWTHQQNLKNMATIRSRWVIQTDDNKKESVAPTPL